MARRIVIQLFGEDRGLRRTTDQADQQLGKLDKSFAGIGKAAKVGFAAAAGAATAALGAIGTAVADAIGNEKVLDRMAASLGATPAVAEKYGKVASNLYAGAWGENLDEVAHAVEAVGTSFRGLSNAGLEKVSAQALDFAAIFETEVPDAVAKASTVVNSGLAKNATEAFDLLTAASQRVPAALRGDLMDASEEYSQFFNAIGLSGEQAFGILVEGSKKGMYGIDKAGDAIKEFTIRATDGSKSTSLAFESIGLDAHKMSNDLLAGGDRANGAFGQIIDGLLSIEDPSERAQTSLALFGTPLEDLGVNGIPKFLQSLKAGTKGMDGWKGSIDDAGKTLNDNAATNLESFKRQISTTFVNFVGGKALPAISKLAAYLQKNVGPAIEKVQPYLRQFGEYLGTKLPGIIDGLTEIFRNATSIIQSIWRTFGSTIVEFLRSSFQNVATILDGAFTVIRGIFQTVSALLKGDWAGVWNGIKTIIRGAVKILTGLVRELWNRIRTAFQIGGTLIKNMIRTTVSGTVALFRAGATQIVAGVRSIPGRLVALGGKFVDAGKTLIGKFFAGLKKLGSIGVQVGKGLINGVIDGVNSGIRAVNGVIPDSIGIGPASIDLPNNPFPTIPRLARGASSFGGGAAVLGEHGRELAALPGGARIYPAHRTEAMFASARRGAAAAGGDDQPMLIQFILDGAIVEQALIRRQRRTGRPIQIKVLAP